MTENRQTAPNATVRARGNTLLKSTIASLEEGTRESGRSKKAGWGESSWEPNTEKFSASDLYSFPV
jgi:hypothetical protein